MSGGRLPECGEPPALFVGEGEMTARIRAMEWSAMPVGPMQGWPQSLCTAVSIMLESRHPMLIWWGPEFTMFYNDAFMALAGSKYPSGLGQRGSEMFADIWPTIGPMLNGVLSSGQATWVDDQLLMWSRHQDDGTAHRRRRCRQRRPRHHRPAPKEAAAVTARFHTTTTTSGAVTVTAIGEIDLATAGQFRDSLAHAGARSDLITIDLTAVDYVDSAGIRVLYEFVASHTLELLVHPSTVPAAALEVSGLLDVVTVQQPSTDPAGEGGAPR